MSVDLDDLEARCKQWDIPEVLALIAECRELAVVALMTRQLYDEFGCCETGTPDGCAQCACCHASTLDIERLRKWANGK
jgi:hypothetical protein